MSTTAVDKSAPMYTWTFKEKSLIIRFFLWIYGKDQKDKLTFCRLFWGVVCSPVTGTLVLLARTLMLIWSGLGWLVATPLEWYGDRSVNRQMAKRARKRELVNAQKEVWRKWREPLKGSDIYFTEGFVEVTYWRDPHRSYRQWKYPLMSAPPLIPPWEQPEAEPVEAGPSIATRIMESVAAFFDHISAWFQEHPGIGRGWERTTTIAGRLLVRFVFYPLMWLIPAAVISGALYLIYEHREGPWHVITSAWDHVFHFFAYSIPHGFTHFLALAGVDILRVLVSFAVAGVLIVGLMYLVYAADKGAAALDGPEKPSRVGMALDRILGQYSPVQKDPGRLAIAAGKVVTGFGRVLGWIAMGFGMVFFAIGYALWVIARSAGRSALFVTRFFIEGHHSVKYRTCPRIKVTSE